MNPQDIAQLVSGLDIAPLTKENFEDFVQNAEGLFVPSGARFHRYENPGYNNLSKDRYDWSKGKPKWIRDQGLVFDRIERREISEKGKVWINVHFRDSLPGVWGVSPDREPLRFAFEPGKALYIAEHEGNGTPEHPWETLYVRLK
jgi:hypothetical protein